MRKLIFGINMSVDGCCDHTKVEGSEEVLDYFTSLLRMADVLVYGRKTYQLMVPFWPDIAQGDCGHSRAMTDFARAFVSVGQIVVFSRSSDLAEGGNMRIARAGLREEIAQMKQGQGGDILTGGVAVPSQLIELGLVDEYRILVHPVLAGEGRRLLEGANLAQRLQLRLADFRSLKSGHLALRYLSAHSRL
jgi:dihydrofolate reductase